MLFQVIIYYFTQKLLSLYSVFIIHRQTYANMKILNSKAFHLLSVLLALFVAGCSKSSTEGDEQPAKPVGGAETITATIYQPESNADKYIDSYWKANGVIDVFSANTYDKYAFKGKTGDYHGEFYKWKSFDAIACRYTGFYAMSNCKGADVADNQLRLLGILNEQQTYSKSDNGISNNTMYSSSEDGDNFVFKSVLGLLRVPLTGFNTVKTVSLKGNNDEIIAGSFYIYTYSPDKLTPKSKKRSIVVDCGTNGLQLSTIDNFDIYFWILPTTFSKGVTISITHLDGSTFEIEHNEPFTVATNELYSLPTLSDFDANRQYLFVSHSGATFIIPTLFDKNSSQIYGTASMGDGSTISLDKYTSYTYSDNKQSHNILINPENATCVNFESCCGISTIDLSQF